MAPRSSSLVLVKYPNKLVPENYLLEAFTKYTTAFGFAFQDEEKKGKVETGTFDVTEEGELIDAFEKMQKSFESSRIFFHLLQVEDKDEDGIPKIDPESFQPFNVITKGDDVLVSLMLSGVFEQFSHEADENTPEYHAVREILGDKMIAIYEQASADVPKMLQLLDQPLVRKEMRQLLLPRGEIHVIPNKGDGIAFSENPSRMDYTWGYASDSLGIETDIVKKEEKVVEASTTGETTAVSQPRPLTIAERKARQQALAQANEGGEKPITPPETTPNKNPNDDKDVVHLPDTKPLPKESNFSYEQLNGKPVLWVRCHNKEYKQCKTFWNTHCVKERPKGTQDSYRQVIAGFPASDLRKDSPLRKALQSLGHLPADKPVDTAMADAMKKASNGKGDPKIAEAAVNEPLLIPAKEKQDYIALSKGVAGMKDVDAELGKYPVFTDQMGVTLAHMLRIPPATLLRYEKRTLINMFNQARMLLWKEAPELFDEPTIVEEQKPEETAEAPKKPLTIAERKAAMAKKVA